LFVFFLLSSFVFLSSFLFVLSSSFVLFLPLFCLLPSATIAFSQVAFHGGGFDHERGSKPLLRIISNTDNWRSNLLKTRVALDGWEVYFTAARIRGRLQRVGDVIVPTYSSLAEVKDEVHDLITSGAILGGTRIMASQMTDGTSLLPSS